MANLMLPFREAKDFVGKIENTDPEDAINTFFLIHDLREYGDILLRFD